MGVNKEYRTILLKGSKIPDNIGSTAVSAVAAKSQIAALTAIATANATDETTAIALVNECKSKINAIISALKA